MIYNNIKIELRNGVISDISTSEGKIVLIIDEQIHIFEEASLSFGFIDSHLHFFGIGEVALMPNFQTCNSESEMIDLLKSQPFYRGDWLVGFGWNQENLPDAKFPTKDLFDNAFPDTPIFLRRIDGHSALINSAAARILGINDQSVFDRTGFIHKNEAGVFTGLLIDGAMTSVLDKIPLYSPEQIYKILDYSQNLLLNLGITEVVDMDFNPLLFQFFKKYDEDGKFIIKIHSFIQAQDDYWLKINDLPYKGNNWNIIGIKLYMDGAIGSRSAALLEEYSDDPNNFGLLLHDNTSLSNKISQAFSRNLQVAIHSIGDRATKIILETINTYPNEIILPIRIEHSQIIDQYDYHFFNNPNIIASVQPIHYVSDTINGMAQKRLGTLRVDNAYPWKSLLINGSTMVAGSDAPIESPNPFFGIDALINSARHSELVSINQAIDSYIDIPYKLLHNTLPSLNIGSSPNIVILDSSFKNTKSIANTKVLAVIINGILIKI
jgi:predicted amidohydrolase YtcJ